MPSPMHRFQTGDPNTDRALLLLQTSIQRLEALLEAQAAASGAGTVPTGTGFSHITASALDAAAKLVANADVHPSAGIAVSKLGAGANGYQLRSEGGAVGWYPAGEVLLCAFPVPLDDTLASGATRDDLIYTAPVTPTGKNRVNITRWVIRYETLMTSATAPNANTSLGKSLGASGIASGVVMPANVNVVGDVYATVSSTVDMPNTFGYEGFLDAGQSLYARTQVNYANPITVAGQNRIYVWGRHLIS